MNTYKVTIKEEQAIRQWQNVLAFGSHHETTNMQTIQQPPKVTFEVLP